MHTEKQPKIHVQLACLTTSVMQSGSCMRRRHINDVTADQPLWSVLTDLQHQRTNENFVHLPLNHSVHQDCWAPPRYRRLCKLLLTLVAEIAKGRTEPTFSCCFWGGGIGMSGAPTNDNRKLTWVDKVFTVCSWFSITNFNSCILASFTWAISSADWVTTLCS